MPQKTNYKLATKLVKFTLKAPAAKKVYLAGDFNNWEPEKTPLKIDNKTGEWKKSIRLKPGKYQYKFVVDGQWWTDPNAAKTEWNNLGSQNSILEI